MKIMSDNETYLILTWVWHMCDTYNYDLILLNVNYVYIILYIICNIKYNYG